MEERTVNTVFCFSRVNTMCIHDPITCALLFGMRVHRVGNDTSILQFPLKAPKLMQHSWWQSSSPTESCSRSQCLCRCTQLSDTPRAVQLHPFSGHKAGAHLLWKMILIFLKRKASSQHFHLTLPWKQGKDSDSMLSKSRILSRNTRAKCHKTFVQTCLEEPGCPVAASDW